MRKGSSILDKNRFQLSQEKIKSKTFGDDPRALKENRETGHKTQKYF